MANPKTWEIFEKPLKIVTLAQQYAIVTGLSDNDWVVVSGVTFLNNKQTISPLAVRIDDAGEIFQLADQSVLETNGSTKP